jgi:hypothetical protein
VLFLCTPVFFGYGWSFISTVFDTGGMNGQYYIYYKIGKATFVIYNFLIAAGAASFIYLTIRFISNRNIKSLQKLFWYFFAFAVVVIICEVILQMRFEGKG